MRVATKYITLTRDFFADHGVVDYRIVARVGDEIVAQERRTLRVGGKP